MWLRDVLFFVELLCSVRGQVKVEKEVYSWVGADVVLKCIIEIEEEKIRQVTWSRSENAQNVDFLTYVKNSGKTEKLTPFAESRVDFLWNGNTDGSIRIRNVALTDESVYTCICTSFPLGAFLNRTSLIVQAKPDVHVEPSPNLVVAKLPYQTVAVCVARAAKPAANITWRTGGLDYNSSEHEIRNVNGTVTTESQLAMIPGAGIKDRSVTCIISQGLALSPTEKQLTIQNVQYPPDSVRVEVIDNGAVQFICLEDSSPPATNFTWRRKDTFDSKAAVQLGNGKYLSMKNFQNGLYICEVTNPIGTSLGYLYFYKVTVSYCLHGCLWPFFILLFLGLGAFIYWRYNNIIKKKAETVIGSVSYEQPMKYPVTEE